MLVDFGGGAPFDFVQGRLLGRAESRRLKSRLQPRFAAAKAIFVILMFGRAEARPFHRHSGFSFVGINSASPAMAELQECE